MVGKLNRWSVEACDETDSELGGAVKRAVQERSVRLVDGASIIVTEESLTFSSWKTPSVRYQRSGAALSHLFPRAILRVVKFWDMPASESSLIIDQCAAIRTFFHLRGSTCCGSSSQPCVLNSRSSGSPLWNE